MKSFYTDSPQRGNVLFLILIAVALFAALSYAVTQTTRTGGNDVEDEKFSILAAQTLQYPTTLKATIMRMGFSGIDATELEFNPPSAFGSLSSNAAGVFHPSGGGAPYIYPPTDIMAGGAQGIWHFNLEFEIENIGTSQAGLAGNDLVAFLPGISKTFCNLALAKFEIGNSMIAAADFSADYNTDMDNAYVLPVTQSTLGDVNTSSLSNKPFGCFRNGDGQFVYYHVLLER